MILVRYFVEITTLFLVIAVSIAGCAQSEGPVCPSIIVIIIDTLRADHLGCYGYERDTSPSIDSLAETGMLFLDNMGQSPWTLPATTTILTGLTPQAHRAGQIGDMILGLDPCIESLATIMSSRGYPTFGYFSVSWLSASFGFDRGYDFFLCHEDKSGHADETIDSFIRWSRSIQQDQPFFATLHFFEPHQPYEPAAPYRDAFPVATDSIFEGTIAWLEDEDGSILYPQQRDYLVSMYDAEILHVDTALEKLFAYLRETGRDSSTVILITADHGEEFLDHGGTGHGHTLYQEMLHIPLIIAGPGVPSDSICDMLVGQIDIVPTLLVLSGIEVPPSLQGIDLLHASSVERGLPSGHPREGTMYCYRLGDLKQCCDLENEYFPLFDLAQDPRELLPLQTDSSLMEEVDFYLLTPPVGHTSVMQQDDAHESLRSLGYI